MSNPTPKLDPGFQAQLRELFFDPKISCPRCHYSLAGLKGSICPECGHDVDECLRIAFLKPWLTPEAKRKAHLKTAMRMVVWMLGMVAATSVCVAASRLLRI